MYLVWGGVLSPGEGVLNAGGVLSPQGGVWSWGGVCGLGGYVVRGMWSGGGGVGLCMVGGVLNPPTPKNFF